MNSGISGELLELGSLHCGLAGIAGRVLPRGKVLEVGLLRCGVSEVTDRALLSGEVLEVGSLHCGLAEPSKSGGSPLSWLFGLC